MLERQKVREEEKQRIEDGAELQESPNNSEAAFMNNNVVERSKSSRKAKELGLKRADYPDDVVKLVMKLRAASYKMGGTDLVYLFGKLDKDKSGQLDNEEFKLTLRRLVDSGDFNVAQRSISTCVFYGC